MGAKYSDKIQIDTTHFVCTTPAGPAGGRSVTMSTSRACGVFESDLHADPLRSSLLSFPSSSGPSVEYQKALQLTLPVVEPGWVLACLHEKK